MKKPKFLLLLPFLLLTIAFIQVQVFEGAEKVVNTQEEQYYRVKDFEDVKKFDIHIHINTEEEFFMEQAQVDNFRFLDIIDDEMTFSQGYYGAHPEYHMYLHPEYPSYQDQIDARDHMLEKHPKLTFMGAHLGSLEWSLDELAKRLDKFPNMYVDLTRLSNLQLHTFNNRQKTRAFFIKYQDRLIYGTDSQINPSTNPESSKKSIHDRWLREWKFYVTDEKISLENFGTLEGLKLPTEVVDKIYAKNAIRLLGLQSW